MEYYLPTYMDDVVERLVERDWLTHNFPLDHDSEIYNPADFLYQIESHGFKYTLRLDFNIYQYIVNSYKKDVDKEVFKDAIALVIFCQKSGINLEPNYALYEKIGYLNNYKTLDEILSDLELFYRIDHADTDSLAKYLLGHSKKYTLAPAIDIDKKYIGEELTKFQRLKEWDSIYLMVLNLAYQSNRSDISHNKKLLNYIEWLITKFRLSLVAIVFGIVFFGRKPMKKMLKYQRSQSSEEKRSSLHNMTWDLYVMSRYFRDWTDGEKNEEFLYASGDMALNTVLRSAIKVQSSGSLICLSEYLSVSELSHVEKIASNPNDFFERTYQSEVWTPSYRALKILEYEKLLGVV